MKRMMLVVASVFMLSCVATSYNALAQDIRSETKKEQDKAYEAGKKRAEGYKDNKGGSPKDDGYKDMDDDTKDAYKKGYRDGQ